MMTCNQKKTCGRQKRSKFFSWLPTFLLIILPKCPFCLMAYSGAISLCSGKMMYPHADSYSVYIIGLLSILTCAGIIFNYRDKRTNIAIGLALLGVVLILSGQLWLMSEVAYYIGVLVLIFGIWFNGSFLFVFRKYISSKYSFINATEI